MLLCMCMCVCREWLSGVEWANKYDFFRQTAVWALKKYEFLLVLSLVRLFSGAPHFVKWNFHRPSPPGFAYCLPYWQCCSFWRLTHLYLLILLRCYFTYFLSFWRRNDEKIVNFLCHFMLRNNCIENFLLKLFNFKAHKFIWVMWRNTCSTTQFAVLFALQCNQNNYGKSRFFNEKKFSSWKSMKNKIF